MVKIKFIKPYANKKKGDIAVVDSVIASSIIKKGVAEVYKKKNSK